MTARLVYRGVSVSQHESQGLELRPKETSPFRKSPEFGRAEWGNAFWGDCEANAVVEHQQHQAGYPTSGISTTPHLERAQFYATHGGVQPRGFVYTIDLDACRDLGVAIYVVAEIVPMPSIPEDAEIILVARDFAALPRGIVIAVDEFRVV